VATVRDRIDQPSQPDRDTALLLFEVCALLRDALRARLRVGYQITLHLHQSLQGQHVVGEVPDDRLGERFQRHATVVGAGGSAAALPTPAGQVAVLARLLRARGPDDHSPVADAARHESGEQVIARALLGTALELAVLLPHVAAEEVRAAGLDGLPE